MRFVKTLVLGITLAAAAPGLHAQAKPASGTGTSPATPAAKPAPQAAKPVAQAPAKSAAQAPAKPAAASSSGAQSKPAAPVTNKPAATAAKPAAPKTAAAKPAPKQAAKKSARRAAKPVVSATPAADKEVKVAKRDPFESLVGREHAGPRTDLPQGKAGLQVGTLRLDGIVRAPNGMIAVVSNPQSRTYFLREGDQLYDGRVEKIAMDGVSFHEIGKDAFGKPVERQVNKRIYASAGEQQ
jgi:Tfp pilus assembly protein PilP